MRWAFVAWILWAEVAVTLLYVMRCPWPRVAGGQGGQGGYRVLMVADPQLTDFVSYAHIPSGPLLTATEFYSDLYMHRSFRALQAFRQASQRRKKT